MEQGAPLDEIALILVECMFHFHICILSETKYWTTNWEHKIGMYSLLLGLTGNMEFTVIEYCTKQSGVNKDNRIIENNLNTVDHHNTSTDSSSSLSDKLTAVSDLDKILELIKLHAEQMSRSPTPKDNSPIPTPPHPQRNKRKVSYLFNMVYNNRIEG